MRKGSKKTKIEVILVLDAVPTVAFGTCKPSHLGDWALWLDLGSRDCHRHFEGGLQAKLRV